MAWNPDQYEKFKDERTRPALDLISMMSATPGGHGIDLGCGTGELTHLLRSRLKLSSVIGLDSSSEMLSRASAGDGVSFIAGDIRRWSALAAYDVIFSNAALQWVGDHRGLFARLRAALRPGGQLAVQMPMNHDYPTHMIAAEMSRSARWLPLLGGEPYDKFAAMLSVEDYASSLFSLGFAEQDVVLRVYPQVVPSRESVVEWVRGSMLTYFSSRLSPADFALFLDEFRTRLFAQLPDEKPFFYPFKRVLMRARLEA